MRTEELMQTLREVEGARRRTRSDLRALWFPLLLFGGLILVSAPVSLADDPWSAIYWAMVSPVGVAVTAAFYRRRGAQAGLVGAGWGYLATAVLLLLAAPLAAGVLSELVSGRAGVVAPWIAVSLAYLVFAWLERSVVIAVVTACLGALALLFASNGVSAGTAAPLLALAYGLSFVALGVAYRSQVRAAG
jgi:hypothetical protein